MAFNPAPSHWIPNWFEDGTNVSVPIASFPELTAAEADAATGDARKVWFALLEQLRVKWLATTAADRPAKMTVSSSATVNGETNTITRSYVISFQLTPSSLDVTTEA